MISYIPALNASSSALEAERARIDIISQNIANANTTRAANGRPYQRQQVVFESMLQQAAGSAGTLACGPRVARIVADPDPGPLVHSPGHPDADEQGMLAMPNVNIHEEMADMISASRAYEANLAVIKNSRQLAMQALSIGKR